MPLDWRPAIRERATALGFDAVGFARTELPARVEAGYRAFVELGRHGDMDWLAETFDRRKAPRALWPEVRSVIVLGMNYSPSADPLEALSHPDAGSISVYARHRDYHDVIKGKLKQLGQWLVARSGGEIKVFVDTAPVLEKPLAEQAGLGWQGKHSNLVSRDFGSWLFLGEIFTTLDIPQDRRGADRCGSCRACLDICPTSAFPAPYQLDARRCISYLTIEHKGHIPAEFRKAMGNRIYGCDDCLAVCPWNKFSRAASEAKLQARDDLNAPPLAELARLDDAAFRKKFAGSPIRRIGRDRFVRNVLIAIGNGPVRAELAGAAGELLDDPSPLVRAMAVWALGQLVGRAEFEDRTKAPRAREADRDVLGEYAEVVA
ncbi:MAG: tRNA epoxyqueuosine(34) reductase QueG [Rhizobiales bacterium]|nr:tRNA epoxyqueuosine(34) reductase QueG [Hyphomicrobiales bacterium]